VLSGTAGGGALGDASAGADGSCPQPIDAFTCDQSAALRQCWPTWAEVMSNPPNCQSGGLDFVREQRGACGAYYVRILQSTDTSTRYYFDATSGALVAVYVTGPALGAPHCSAGPANGVSADCRGLLSLDSVCTPP